MPKTFARYLALFIALIATSSSLSGLGSGSGAISVSNGTPIVQTFDSLANTGAGPFDVLIPGWYLEELGTGPAADGRYIVGTGSSNGGNTYSFGLAALDADRALGSVGSGSVSTVHSGAQLMNTGSGP